MEKRRAGRINIVRNWLLDDRLDAQCVFHNFLPVQITYYWPTDSQEYVGISKYFDEVDAGEIPPLYNVEVTDGFARFIRQ